MKVGAVVGEVAVISAPIPMVFEAARVQVPRASKRSVNFTAASGEPTGARRMKRFGVAERRSMGDRAAP